MAPVREEVDLGELALHPDPAEPPEFISPLLGLRLTLDEANQLQFYELTTGSRLLSDEEAQQAAEAAAQSAAHQAEQEALRADQEAQRAAQAEAENARLRAELAKLRGDQ